jgi:anti-sigma B factor antagonist
MLDNAQVRERHSGVVRGRIFQRIAALRQARNHFLSSLHKQDPLDGRPECAFPDRSTWALVFYSRGRSAAPVTGEKGISMTVKMTNSEVDGVSVVALDGRIVLGEESNSLRDKLKSLTAQGKKKIVLNMANIKYIDSAGLGTLIAVHVSAKTQGASVRLCHLGRKFHEVLQITKLLTIFDVYDTQAAAVSSF